MGEQDRAAEEELTKRALDRERAGRRHLEHGRAERAVREFESALDVDPEGAELRELLLEAHRCRNALYWALRGYWRWAASWNARWIAYPMFVALMLAAIGAEAAGGFEVLGRVPRFCEPNALAESLQIAALAGVFAFVAPHEHKCAWVLDRLLTLWLVPAPIRARCLDERSAAEHRRAVAYAVAVIALLGSTGAALVCSL